MNIVDFAVVVNKMDTIILLSCVLSDIQLTVITVLTDSTYRGG